MATGSDPFGRSGGATASVPDSAGDPGARGETFLLGTWVVAVLIAVAVMDVVLEHRGVHDPIQRAARGEIKGVGSGSLIRPDRLRLALAKVGRDLDPESVVTSFRLAPDRINMTIRDSQGRRSLYNVDPALNVDHSSFGEGLEDGFSIRRVPVEGARRAVLAAAARHGTGPGDIDYMVLDYGSITRGGFSWNIFFKTGRVDRRQYFADGDGGNVRRPGEARTP
jgi:hypothetical protein